MDFFPNYFYNFSEELITSSISIIFQLGLIQRKKAVDWEFFNYPKNKSNLSLNSATRLGWFWKVLVINSHIKETQVFGNLRGKFEKGYYLAKTAVATFGQHLDKIRLLFIPASGHTS